MKGSGVTGKIGRLTRETRWYEFVKVYVTGQLPRCPDLDKADLPTRIAGALTAHLDRTLPPGESPEPRLLEGAFSEVVLSLCRADREFMFLLVYQLVHGSLRARLPRDACDPLTSSGERLAELRSQALFDTQSGQKILQGYLTQLSERAAGSESNYWKFLKKSITHVVIDRLRRVGEWRRFAEAERAFGDQGEMEEDERGKILVAPSTRGNPHRQMERRDRREARKMAVERLMALAQEKESEPDWRILKRYMEWVQGNPDLISYSQAEFARATGIPQGTVNSSLKRVRDGLPRSSVKDIDLGLLATTAGG